MPLRSSDLLYAGADTSTMQQRSNSRAAVYTRYERGAAQGGGASTRHFRATRIA